MTRRSPALWRLMALLLALVLVAAACGDDDDENGSSDTTTEDTGGSGDGGSITITGSSTVEPISNRVVEKFNADNPDVAISVDGPGTGDGFEIFCNGEADISDASRPIKPEELETCTANGIDVIELKVGIDGLSVVTSVNNDAVDCLSFGDLYALLGPESTGFGNWSDADELAGELPEGYGASNAPFPDADLSTIVAPGVESGTYDSFVELVLEGIAEERGQEPEARLDYQASPNDNVIIEGIGGSDTSLGWVGYAFVAENPESVKALAVDGGDGCVEPTPETIASGEFPIARPLYIYVSAQALEENAAVESFVDFYLSDDGIASVTEADYVALDDAELETTRAAWEAKETGTREG
ncbi:MAG TPA: substrate-binding domain-containing protein [Acidimicrobiia bacterium]|nr:substrate-binding domain-containing protein [Acidimicrobiia bacterium]